MVVGRVAAAMYTAVLVTDYDGVGGARRRIGRQMSRLCDEVSRPRHVTRLEDKCVSRFFSTRNGLSAIGYGRLVPCNVKRFSRCTDRRLISTGFLQGHITIMRS